MNTRNMEATLQAFYYLTIQLYVFSEVYASLYKTRVLQKLYGQLDDNMSESKSKHLTSLSKYFKILQKNNFQNNGCKLLQYSS